MKLLSRIQERRRKRAERKLGSAAASTVYSHSPEGRAARAAAEKARRDAEAYLGD